MIEDPVEHFFASDESRLLVLPTLDALEEQAENADRTRSVASNVIESLRGSDVMRMAATSELGGVESSILAMGREFNCRRGPSTVWCLGTTAVFHLFVGTLGPGTSGFLEEIVHSGHWVSFPAGPVAGLRSDRRQQAILNGSDVRDGQPIRGLLRCEPP